jgi:hypothetical protein
MRVDIPHLLIDAPVFSRALAAQCSLMLPLGVVKLLVFGRLKRADTLLKIAECFSSAVMIARS